MITHRLSLKEIEQAARLIKEGQLVAFPTETVYGLGAAIFNPDAIASIFKVKGRPADNPLIAHVSSLQQIEEIAEEIPEYFHLLAQEFFPGPFTVVLKRKSHVPSIVSAGLPTIAVRMPSHPIARELICCVGQPLVAPSANLSGKPSSTEVAHVLEDFEGKIAAVIDGGRTDFGLESTVLSLLDEVPVLLRPGAITREQIEKVLKRPIKMATNEIASSPGMKYRHYAPKAPIKTFATLSAIEDYLASQAPAKPMLLSLHSLPMDHFLLTAKDFYALLRLADQKNYSEILVLCDDELQKQTALMNRLAKAKE